MDDGGTGMTWETSVIHSRMGIHMIKSGYVNANGLMTIRRFYGKFYGKFYQLLTVASGTH